MLRTLFILLACTVATSTAAQTPPAPNLHPFERYVAVDVTVRELTVEGMRTRLALLRDTADPAQRQHADEQLDGETQQRIASFYAASGTSASRHAAFGSRFEPLIAQWLDEHPDWRSRTAAVDAEFQSLSSQFSAAR